MSRCRVFNPIIIHAIYDMSYLSYYFRSIKLINDENYEERVGHLVLELTLDSKKFQRGDNAK